MPLFLDQQSNKQFATQKRVYEVQQTVSEKPADTFKLA